jgi:hypothetical protein
VDEIIARLPTITLPDLLHFENKPSVRFETREHKLVAKDGHMLMQHIYYYSAEGHSIDISGEAKLIAVIEQSGIDRINKTEDIAQGMLESLIEVAYEYQQAINPQAELHRIHA